ncbi:hypothetical protein EW146_g1740 [Bondarzewia mesenterica]|uniref:DNA/RNA-binding domain-containing protein n=1 Tax=Bondarzewia mesenterica TaxID=1095465 RepID=A0A4S4M4A4_9AGAM|nr:hypothetical protein EW146_g1740 [Bondarzewia mesenterica]
MSEGASAIAREAKSLHQGLKELLKSRDPWDREVEFQRKNLQKQYLLLLLAHPSAPESKDAETYLWMQTSYALISVYKQRLATLDRTVRDTGNQRQQGRPQRHGPVEHRKLLQRFKQFLAQEEKFWTQLVVRIQRQFALTEARAPLVQLGFLSSSEGEAVEENDAGEEDVNRERSHFRFPPEPPNPQPVLSSAQRESRLTMLSKALVCLGDLARYREQYSESNGRPRAGHEEGPRRSGRNRRQGAPEPARARNYDKAKTCYERARDLVPEEGNASHQLAILAAYQRDTFESLVHYYKALCVRVSYEPAAENMGNVLAKFLDLWKSKKRMHAVAAKEEEKTLAKFSTLVSERSLPIDTITKVLVLAQGALWKHQMLGAPSKRSGGESSAAAAVESRIVAHLFALHLILLQRGIAELDEAAKIAEDDIAMRITATFRRMLPALRIAGKWLRANLAFAQKVSAPIGRMAEFWDTYNTFAARVAWAFPPESLPRLKQPLEEDVEMSGFLPLKGRLGGEKKMDNDGQMSDSGGRMAEEVHPNEEQLMRIWDIWHDAQLLADARGAPIQPYGQSAKQPKTEEVDNRYTEQVPDSPANNGWLGSGNQVESGVGEMDEDARTETTDPVGDAFRAVLKISEETEEEEDEIVWDPRAISPRTHSHSFPNMPTPHARAQSGPGPISPISPVKPSFDLSPTSPTSIKAVSPPKLPGVAATRKTTAQDLLNNVMGVGRPTVGADRIIRPPSHQPSVPQQPSHSPLGPQPVGSIGPPPPLLFSPTTHGGYGAVQSIWATAPDEGALRYHQRQPSGSFPLSSPLGGQLGSLSQGSWPSSFNQSSQASQSHAVGALPSTTVSPSMMQNVHRHVPSASVQTNHVYVGLGSGQYDAAFYSSSPHNVQTMAAISRPVGTPNIGQGSFVNPADAFPPSQSLYMQDSHTNRHRVYGSLDISKHGDIHQSVSGIWGGAG